MLARLRNQLPADLAEELPRCAVYGALIRDYLELTHDTAKAIERQYGLPADDLYGLGVRSCPSLTLNLLVSAECLSRFGGDVLRQTPGFYDYDRSSGPCYCLEFQDACVCSLRTWRLDIDPGLARTGAIIPQRNRVGWITKLWVFRSANDQRPFALRVRQELAA